MNKEYLYIGIGAVIFINFILFFVVSGKKKAAGKVRSTRPQPANVHDEEVSQERHTKTEALGVPKSAPQVKDSNKTEALGVPTSAPSVSEQKASGNGISIPTIGSAPSGPANQDNKTVALGIDFPKVPALQENEKTQLLMHVQPESAPEVEVAAAQEVQPLASITYSVNEVQHTFAITATSIKIGRDPEGVDLVLAEEKFAGRVHAQIEYKDNKFYLADLNSKNGTFVGGEKLSDKVELTDGAVFTIGKTELTLKVGA